MRSSLASMKRRLLAMPRDLISGRNVDYARTIWAKDLRLGIVAGAVAGVACLSDGVRADGSTMLLASTAIGAAFLAAVLTALSVVATFFDAGYRQILERAHDGDIRGVLFPYAVVAYAGAAATIVGLLGAITWPALPGGIQAVVLGAAVLMSVWTVAGTAQLVELTLFHARMRVSVMRSLETAREARVRSAARTRSRTPERPTAE